MTELEVADADAAPRAPVERPAVRSRRAQRGRSGVTKTVVHPRRTWPYVVLSLLAAIAGLNALAL